MKEVFKLQSAFIVNKDGSRIDPKDFVWSDLDSFDNSEAAEQERIRLMKRQEGAGHNFQYIRVVKICE